MLKLIIISLILVAFVMLALGIKTWFDPGAEFTVHSCAHDKGDFDENGFCLNCQMKDPDYAAKEGSKSSTHSKEI